MKGKAPIEFFVAIDNLTQPAKERSLIVRVVLEPLHEDSICGMSDKTKDPSAEPKRKLAGFVALDV